jgi:serine/threonine-protein phosphatase 2B regulatory subunit
MREGCKPTIEDLLKRIPNLNKRDILSFDKIKDNPITIILIKMFTINNKLDTHALVLSLYNFVESKTIDDKLYFLFTIYDTNSDGLISNTELFELLKTLNKGILEDFKIHNIVDRTMSEIGEYLQFLNYEQFKKLIVDRCENLKILFNCTQ